MSVKMIQKHVVVLSVLQKHILICTIENANEPNDENSYESSKKEERKVISL